MTLEAYRVALEQAKKDLAAKITEVGAAERTVELGTKQIVELRQTIAVLSKLCGESEYVEEDALGITDVVRMTYRSAVGEGNGLSAQDVRDRIESMGYAGRWANLLASVHTVTNRLFKMGEIEASGNLNGRETFRWKKTILDRAAESAMTSLYSTKFDAVEAAKRLETLNETLKSKQPAPRKQGFIYDKSPEPPKKR